MGTQLSQLCFQVYEIVTFSLGGYQSLHCHTGIFFCPPQLKGCLLHKFTGAWLGITQDHQS